ALFTIGEIYRDDLRDQAQAKATFEDYIKHYPNSSLAPDARAILSEITESEKRDPFKKKSARSIPEVTAKAAWIELPSPKHEPINEQAANSSSDDQEQVTPANTVRSSRKKTTEAPLTTAKPTSQSDADATVASPQPLDTALDKIESPGQPHKTSRMTGVRHWSTPDYTRVAINLEQEVEYQAGRVPRPDRIFFDLYSTKLAP